MTKHEDFIKIENRFISQYEGKEGPKLYSAFIIKKGYDDTKPFPKSRLSEKKERMCAIRGVEIKETELAYHVEGLIATSHIDDLDLEPGIEIPDMIPKETLESLANQGNSNFKARVMGYHHSEGNPMNPEYFGVADTENTPLKVIPLTDGHWGLYADTKLLKNDPMTPTIIKEYEDGTLNGFSITYDTKEFMTTDFDFVENVYNEEYETGSSEPRSTLDYYLIHGLTLATLIAGRKYLIQQVKINIYVFSVMLDTGFVMEKGDVVTFADFLSNTNYTGQRLGIERDNQDGVAGKVNEFFISVVNPVPT